MRGIIAKSDMTGGLLRKGKAVVFCVAVFGLAPLARATAGVAITRVEVPGWTPPSVGLQGPYMKKFSAPEPAGPNRVVRVVWQADEALPRGTLIIFEYRTDRGRDKLYYVKTDRALRGRQETMLPIEEAGEIVAWRVRIAAGSRQLATRASASWR